MSCSRLRKCLSRSATPGRPANGFALPVAVGASLVLLLSSGSLQLLALQSRVQATQQWRRHQLEDVLASAAQQQVAALQAAGSGCLLALDQAQWAAAAPACQIDAIQLAALQQGQLAAPLDARAYRIAAYRRTPAAAGAAAAELELQLIGERPWRAAFRLSLAAAALEQGWQVVAVQELGLRGAGA